MPRLFLIFLVIASITSAHAPMKAWSTAPQAMVASLPDADHARQWLAERQAHLLARPARDPETRREIQDQLGVWQDASRYLARYGGQRSPKGFVIYPPDVTLSLFLLDRVEEMYAAALVGPVAVPSVDELFTLAGQPLEPSTPGKYPSVRRARTILESIDVSPAALRGYRVFLLPFSMGEVSGQGGPGFAFVAAEPRDELLIRNQLEVTLVHEFGHHLHLCGMPRETKAGREKWQEYLRMRHLAWSDDGRVKTESWARSSEEAFAEDFRLLFGGPLAGEETSATKAGNPRRGQEASQLRRFMMNLARGIVMPPSQDTWPEAESAAWRARGPFARPWVAGLTSVLGLGVLGLALRLWRRGAGIRPSETSTVPSS